MKKSLFLALLSLHAIDAQASTNSTVVKGNDPTLNCNAYLHIPDDVVEKLPLVLWEAGSGIYSASEVTQASDYVVYLFTQKKIAVLTYDKPGIAPNLSDPNSPVVDDLVYNKHTQRDLIACAKNALIWAASNDHLNKEVFFAGHSEGSMILTRLYNELLTLNSDLVPQIQALLLSGTPLLGFRDTINSQLTNEEDRTRFWEAISQKDDQTLRTFGGLAFTYWDDILATEPLGIMLRKMAELKPDGSFNFFHGLHDKNTDVSALQDLETWNQSRATDGNRPHLHLSARYYNADHQLNLSAVNDMAFMLMAYLWPRYRETR